MFAIRSVTLALIVSSAVPAMAAHRAWLTHAEIETALGGKSIEGRYASGRAFTERYLPNGQLEYAERGRVAGGHWSVTSGTLCTIYDDDLSGGCYRVVRASENCFEFYFVSRTEALAPGPVDVHPAWTARGAVEGQPSACREGANV